MQVTETLNEGLKRAYSITVPASELAAKVNEKLEAQRTDFHMKGFRKGKAPLALMKKMFGKSVMGEAMQESIDNAMREHFSQSGDRPAQQPQVNMLNENWSEGDDVEVSLTYEALPDVPEVDFSAVALERMVAEIDEAAVAEALENLAGSTTTYDKRRKGSKARDKDQVVIDFVGSIDGVEFEGGKAEDFPLVLGSGSFIPGFEDQLVGAKEGDSLSVNVSFPENYGAKELAGMAAVFAVTVKSLNEPKPAPIDDDLAKRYGADDLEALKGQIRERLADEYKGASRAVMKRHLMDALDDLVGFDLPPSLVEAEAAQIAHQLWHDEHPEHPGHDHDKIEPTDEHTRLAARRVRLGLLLAEVGNKASIQVTEEETRQAIFRAASQYPGQERAFLEFMQKNPGAQQQLRAPIFEDKVVDHIFGLALVTDKSVTREELQKAIEALEDE